MKLLSPKARFLETAHAKVHGELVHTAHLQEAVHHALLEMIYSQSSPNMNEAAANQYRIEGARRFIATFLTLADPPIKPARTLSDSLPHPEL